MGRRVDETFPKLQRNLDHRDGALTPMSPWVTLGSLPKARELKHSTYEFFYLLPNDFQKYSYHIETPNPASIHD